MKDYQTVMDLESQKLDCRGLLSHCGGPPSPWHGFLHALSEVASFPVIVGYWVCTSIQLCRTVALRSHSAGHSHVVDSLLNHLLSGLGAVTADSLLDAASLTWPGGAMGAASTSHLAGPTHD